MDPPDPATAVLILRAWAEAGAGVPLRFRITRCYDVDASDVDSVVATSVGDVVDVVEQWAAEWARRATDR